MITHPRLTIRDLRAVAVEVPMTYALGTSRGAITKAPLLLIDLDTEEGVTGRAYLFCYLRAAAPAIASLLSEVFAVTKGDVVAPLDLQAKLARRFALIGVQGITRMAMSGFDVACWDALSIAASLSLARFVGSTPKPVPAYNSCGLGLMAPEAVADEAEKLARGFRAVKLRLGYPTLKEDLAALAAVRGRIPGTTIMVDYNQALSVAEALERGRALDQEGGVYWLEEPIRHDDYAGAAALARELKVPVQIGENFSWPYAMATALAAGACDYVMPDLERIGGVTGWLSAAALAHTHGIAMSSHLFPEVSAHLLAAAPTGHWLEWVDWANAILTEPLRLADGCAVASERPGNGLVWDAKAVDRYRM